MSVTMPVRVTVLDAWDEVTLDVPADTSVGEVKRRAMEVAMVTEPSKDYLVKYLGAELSDESGSLAAAGVVPNGALIVLRRRRVPTR